MDALSAPAHVGIPTAAEIVTRWMSFREEGDTILALRRQVFIDEQGFEPDFVTSPHDAEGLHLGVFLRDELVSIVSAYVSENSPEVLAQFQLPLTSGCVVQFSKRVVARQVRDAKFNQAHAAIMVRAVYEALRPDYFFLVLKGAHRKLKAHYNTVFGFEHHASVMVDGDECDVMLVLGEPKLRVCYRTARKIVRTAIETQGIKPPSLIRFLDRTGRMALVILERFKQENLYMEPLSLKDELPRLSAQTRVLYREQKSRLAATDFPPAPARLLDLGAGPGVYLSLLKREPKFRGYELVGLDLSPEMVIYARLNRGNIRWIEATAYQTGEPDQSYNVVHVNFLFMHLLCPELALREVHRILRPSGIFYVFEINDDTFRGPPEIMSLVQSHCDLYMGNRAQMTSLPHLAMEHGLELVQRFSTQAKNTGTENEPTITGDVLCLNRIMMWSLFAVLGQREELADQFKAAQEIYFNSSCEISVDVETHVYRKSG